MKILLTGGTGFIGSALCEKLLSEGHELVLLTRNKPSKKKKGVDYFQFDYLRDELDVKWFSGVSVVIHLAGEDLSSSRWSKEKKASIRSSRIDYTEKLASFINRNVQLDFFLSASAIGFYDQSKNDECFDETSPNGRDFLSFICRDCEHEVHKV